MTCAITTVRIFPSVLPGQPVLVREWTGTLHGFFAENCPGYRQDADCHPLTAFVGDEVIPPERWDDQALIGQTIDLRPIPHGPISVAAVGKAIGTALISMALSYVLNRVFGKKQSSPDQRTAQDLLAAGGEGNAVRRNDIVPEVAGRETWHYPDQICQRRLYFADKRTQAVDIMLCVGVGEYAIHQTRVGATDAAEFGSAINLDVFGPGATVSGHPAHRNWYNCPNVGPTLGGSGIRLTAGAVSGTVVANLSAAILSGSSLLVPSGGGVLPQDWEVGQKISIVAYTRHVTVVDGGGTFFSPVRDKVRGDFADLGLSVSDIVYFGGGLDGRFRVASVASTTEAGSASTIVGSVVAELSFATTPVTLYVAGQSVVLDADFADADELITEMNAQLGGATVSHDTGVITITDDSPYDGQNISLSGNYAPVLGATPYFSSGTASTSYVELTFDVEQTYQEKNWEGDLVWDGDGNPVMVTAWFPAASFAPGEYSSVAIYKSAVYRIESLVTGTLPDSSIGTVGLDLQRLNIDGSDDASWTGFFPETTTSLIDVALEPGQIVGGWSGWFDISPTDEPVSRIEYDLFFPAGLIRYNKEGKIRAHAATVEIQYSINGEAPVSIVRTFTDATADQIGFTYGVDFPAGSKNVRMRCRRIGAEVASSQYSDRVEWYGARSLLPSATSYAGVTTAAITIAGCDLVAAQSQTQISMDVTRKLDGVETRSAVDFARYVIDSLGAADKIDADAFDALKTKLDARGDWFDFAFRDQLNARDQLNRILSVGYAVVTVHQGLALPVREEPVSVPPDCFSRHNILRDSYTLTWAQPDPEADPDGVDVSYVDPTTGKTLLVECRLPGQAGVRAKRISADGIKDRIRAWRFGMRLVRKQRYQVWQHALDTEMDGLNCMLYSPILIVPDLPGYAQSAVVTAAAVENPVTAAGAVVSGDVRLAVSEIFVFQAGVTHAIAWRLPTGKLAGPFDAALGANDREVLALDVPAESFPLITGRQEPPHAYFGKYLDFERVAVVASVTPEGLYKAKLQAANYDARIFADDDNDPD